MAWINVDDVLKFHGVKPQSLGYEKTETEKLHKTINDWINQAEDLIKNYTNNNFKTNVPRSVENVCIRLVSNMITLAIQKRDSPLIKVNDWTITPISSEIFTTDLKEDLKPFIIEKSTTSDTVTFYAITGD